MKIFCALAALVVSPAAWADCEGVPDFTTTMRITSVTVAQGGGCWLSGEWRKDPDKTWGKEADKKARTTPIFTMAPALCAVKVPTTKKIRGSYGCCDAGGMPPPCSWGTDKSMPGHPSGISATPVD